VIGIQAMFIPRDECAERMARDQIMDLLAAGCSEVAGDVHAWFLSGEGGIVAKKTGLSRQLA
jgi:hypothetical protein